MKLAGDDLIEGGIDQIGSRVGVFGGTFDPVHNGHFALVSHFIEKCDLDSVIVIPALNPPHKLSQPLTDFEHRFAMLSLAFSDVKGVVLSRLEQYRDGPSFTIDTLKQLRDLVGQEREWFFAIGEDAFAEIHTWKQYRTIPNLSCLVVFNRKVSMGFSNEEQICKSFPTLSCEMGTNSFFEKEREKIRFLTMPEVNVSSSMVRQAITNGEEWISMVPKAVSSYIIDQNLYLA